MPSRKKWAAYAQTLASDSALKTLHSRSTPSSDAQHRLVIAGDSIGLMLGIDRGKGWVDMLRIALLAGKDKGREDEGREVETSEDWECINWSVGGMTAEAVNLSNFKARLQQTRAAIVVLELGGNDRMFGCPPDHIVCSLIALVEVVQESKALALVMEVVPDGIEREVCERTDAVLVPLPPEILEALGEARRGTLPRMPPQFFQSDGIHPNHCAQPLIAKALASTLDRQEKVPFSWCLTDALPEGSIGEDDNNHPLVCGITCSVM